MEEMEQDKCLMCNTIAFLVDAISNEEIIKVCPNCAEKNKFPIISKPTEEQIKRSHKFYGVRERLYSNRPDLQQVKKEKSEADKELEKHIRETVVKGDYPTLVDNFHWHIQHGRRMKKLSHKQLAESIAEPQVLIELAEQGKLPQDYSKVIIKLEQFLKVRLRKEVVQSAQQTIQETPEISEEENSEEEKEGLFKATANYFKSLFSRNEEAIAEEEEIPVEEKAVEEKKESTPEKTKEEKIKAMREDFYKLYKHRM
jgi:ribosome-binding protein aMBF1 (putative translation factor)